MAGVKRTPVRYAGYGGKLFKASPFADGTQRVYWAPGQSKSSELWSGYLGDPEPYQNPDGWPVVGRVVRRPKTVAFLWFSQVGQRTWPIGADPYQVWQRLKAWNDFADDTAEWMAGFGPDYGVLKPFYGLEVETGFRDSFVASGLQWLQALCPITADVSSGAMLGGDVLAFVFDNGFGAHRYSAYPFYEPVNVEDARSRYQADYPLVAAARERLGRFGVKVYYDGGVVANSPEETGITGDAEVYFFNGFEAGDSFQESWDHMVAGESGDIEDLVSGDGDVAQGLALAGLGFEWKGLADFQSIDVSGIRGQIEEFFEL